MAENLIFNYLNIDDNLPDIDDGNIYFKLISNTTEETKEKKIYGQDRSFEIAVDLDGKMVAYNDAIVDPVYDFNKDIYDFGTPYILFYEKEN